MKSRKPLKTKLDGVSPGCTLLLKKKICDRRTDIRSVILGFHSDIHGAEVSEAGRTPGLQPSTFSGGALVSGCRLGSSGL